MDVLILFRSVFSENGRKLRSAVYFLSTLLLLQIPLFPAYGYLDGFKESAKTQALSIEQLPTEAIKSITRMSRRTYRVNGVNLILEDSGLDKSWLTIIGPGIQKKWQLPFKAELLERATLTNWVVLSPSVGQSGPRNYYIIHLPTQVGILSQDAGYNFSEVGDVLLSDAFLYESTPSHQLTKTSLPSGNYYSKCRAGSAVLIGNEIQTFIYHSNTKFRSVHRYTDFNNYRLCDQAVAFDPDTSNILLTNQVSDHKLKYRIFNITTSSVTEHSALDLAERHKIQNWIWATNYINVYFSDGERKIFRSTDFFKWLVTDGNYPLTEVNRQDLNILNLISNEILMRNKTVSVELPQDFPVAFEDMDRPGITFSLKKDQSQKFRIESGSKFQWHQVHPLGFLLIYSINQNRTEYLLLDLVRLRVFNLGHQYERPTFIQNSQNLLINDFPVQVVVDLYALRNLKISNFENSLNSSSKLSHIESEILTNCRFELNQVGSMSPEAGALLSLREKQALNDDDYALFAKLALKQNLTAFELHLVSQVGQILQKRYIVPLFRYSDLYRQLAALKSIKANPCLDKFLVDNIKWYLESMRNNSHTLDFSEVASLIVLKPFIESTDFSKKAFRDHLTLALNDSASKSYDTSGIFYSARTYLINAVIGPIFGEPIKLLADAAVIRSGDHITIMVISSLPFQNMTTFRNAAGFYHKVIKVFDAGSVPARVPEIQWASGGRNFTANIQITNKGDLRKHVSLDQMPNFKGIYSDRKLNGFIIISGNLGQEEGLNSASAYINFYQRLGFDFQTKWTRNARQYIEGLLSENSIDYMIKDAHSYGDEWAWFQTNDFIQVSIGSKIDDRGVEHKIYIVRSNPFNSNSSTVYFTTHDIEKITNQRINTNQGPLYYLSSSCGSYRMAVNEYSAATSILFAVIPSLGSVYGFNGQGDHIIGRFILGLIHQWDWNTIKSGSVKNAHVSANDDEFLFPNSSEFKSRVYDNLKTAYDVKIEVRDSATNQIVRIGDLISE